MSTSSADSKKIEAYIARIDPPKRQIVEALIELVARAAPKAQLTCKWNTPVFVQEGLLCFVAAFKHHVNFGFYQGAHLADPDSLLNGNGKGMRHVKIRDAKEIRRTQFRKWVKEAVRLNAA